MKKLSFSMLAVAGLLFAGCADNDAIAEGGGTQGGETRSEGYMALNINLPTTSMTRAANDNFDDGIADEYAVEDCALFLFQGEPDGKEEDAKLISVQACGKTEFLDTDNDNITSTYKVAAKISGYTPGKNLYALAMLNYGSYLYIDHPTEGTRINNHVTGQNNTLTPGTTTFADLRKITTEYSLNNLIGDEKKYFFMTNAVMSTVPGGQNPILGAPTADDIFQLAPLNPNKIYSTVDEAEKNPAGEIFVERAVAKATLYYTADGVGTAKAEIGKVEWVIDNIEPTTYILRRPYDDNGTLDYVGYSSAAFTTPNYRFVSHTTTYDNATSNLGSEKNYYRTYWCVDPQYANAAYNYTTPDVSEEDLVKPDMISVTTGFVEAKKTSADPTPIYCTENTFSVQYQDYINTTRAVIRVTLTNSTDPFYTVNGSQTVFTKENAEKELIANIIKNVDVRTAIKQQLNDNKFVTVDQSNFKTYFNINFTSTETPGNYKITSLSLKSEKVGSDQDFKEGAVAAIQTVLNTALDVANNEVVVLQYVKGEMYYEARFKHFAGSGTGSDNYTDLAPWSTWEQDPNKPTDGFTTQAYPGSDPDRSQNYLGRYGMVRNNWYDVEVTAFTNFGSPTYPSLDASNYGTPDDNVKDNISVKIHVLAWAKRTQQWGF